ncbi:MAG: HlyD family efflux transporter periplasmic adaptor subunit [Candidatus Latescibacterota bacterium]|nr:MAG: HlyD family efflux transporter periplasmic adaptor subunit [Candidatus Latescibacterota bacterium]
MKTVFRLWAAAAILPLAFLAAGCRGGAGDGADRAAAVRSGGGEDAAAAEPGDGHGHEEDAVTLTAEAMRLAGVRIREISLESIGRTIELPGEIRYNDERLIHITPRFAGVIREVRARIGEPVRRGEVLAVIESNASLAPYSIEAPIAGRVVEMHASLGEFVGEDRDLFVVADLSTVWADCEAFVENLPFVSVGRPITITAVGSEESVDGTIAYVSSALDPATRSAVVRAIIPGSGLWRPGVFIRGIVRVPAGARVPAVARDAVQLLGGNPVIFVEGDEPGEFRPVAVRTGRRDGSFVELLEGPPPGARYVAEGAFDLKAQIVTREAGAHAGHGH